MPEQGPRSAAQAIFPNLKSGTPDLVQRRQQGGIADAMYAHLKPEPPHRLLEDEVAVSWINEPVDFVVDFAVEEPQR
jgi:hypothetical protein